MNPKQLDKETREKIIELNDVFQAGQRAKEFAQTEYWKQMLDAFEKKTKDHMESKAIVDPLLYKIGCNITVQATGQKIVKTGEEFLQEAITAEAEIRTINDIVNMVREDIENGAIAHTDLEEIKRKYKPLK